MWTESSQEIITGPFLATEPHQGAGHWWALEAHSQAHLHSLLGGRIQRLLVRAAQGEERWAWSGCYSWCFPGSSERHTWRYRSDTALCPMPGSRQGGGWGHIKVLEANEISKAALEEWASLVVRLVKSPPAMQETPVRFLGRADPQEKG